MISSIHNPYIKKVRALMSRRQEREAQSLFVAEGVRLVEDALTAGWTPQWSLFSSKISQRGTQIVKQFLSLNIPALEIAPEIMDAISDTETPQGLLAVFEARSLPVLEKLDFVLILDNIRDPGNLGTILRSAGAAGVQLVNLTPGTTDAFAPKVLRSGMGVHFRIPIQHLSWTEIEKKYRQSPSCLKSFLADIGGEKSLWEADFRQPLILIIGNEAEGASVEARRFADETITIPMPGKIESLNAAISTGILLFEIIRQRQK
jgi:RNA methyltransferase, TrmH family